MEWTTNISYSLDGTYLELVPEYGFSDYYYIIDTRTSKCLTNAMPLKNAKKAVERMFEKYKKS